MATEGDNISLKDTMEKYIVKKGDYLYKIARLYPIDGVSAKKRVYQIYDANPFLKDRRIESNSRTFYNGENFLENEDLLFPGDELMIPGYGDPLKSFELTGLVIDKKTGDPIKGANIKTNIKPPGKVEATESDEFGYFKLKGLYIPAEFPQRPLLKIGAKGTDVKSLQELLAIKIDGDFGPLTENAVKTFQEGNGLEVDGIVGEKTWSTLDNQGNKNKKTFIFDILASKPFYSQEKISPFNLDQSIRDSEIIIPLETTRASSKQAVIQEMLIPQPVLQTIKTAQKTQDPVSFAIQQQSRQILSRIRESLIPQVLQLITQFGIGKAQEALGQKLDELGATCPTNLDDLNDIIKKKNKLTKILENIFNTLETIKIGVDFADKSVTIGQVVLDVTKQIVALFPIAGFGAPDPSKSLLTPGGTLDKVDEFLKKTKVVTSGLLLILTLLTTMLARLISYLSLLDALIQKCYIEGAVPLEQVPTDLFPPETRELGPSPIVVNGFTMKTEVEETQSTIKRKRGIAINPDGVVMLKGEWSFSSNDQILIDELTFYIKQNNLKAD